MIFAKTLASIGAVVAAAAARKTRDAPAFCNRLVWCNVCRPPGIVNWNAEQKCYSDSVCHSHIIAETFQISNSTSTCRHSGEEKRFTWRRAKAEQALSIEEGFRNIATNLPISAALKNRKTEFRTWSAVRSLIYVYIINLLACLIMQSIDDAPMFYQDTAIRKKSHFSPRAKQPKLLKMVTNTATKARHCNKCISHKV